MVQEDVDWKETCTLLYLSVVLVAETFFTATTGSKKRVTFVFMLVAVLRLCQYFAGTFGGKQSLQQVIVAKTILSNSSKYFFSTKIIIHCDVWFVWINLFFGSFRSFNQWLKLFNQSSSFNHSCSSPTIRLHMELVPMVVCSWTDEVRVTD